MKNKSYIAILWMIFLMLSLTACSQQKEPRTGVVYVPEVVDFTSPLDETESACISGDAVYLVGGIRDKKTYDETLALVRVSLEDSTAEKLSGFQSAQFEDGGEYYPISGYLRPGADGTL